MAVSFMTWNVREGLAQPEQMPGVVDVITKARKDVVILPDAYSVKNPLHGSQAATLTEAKERLEEAGYRYMIETEYDDGWWHDRNIMMLGRVPLLATNVIRLGARNALEAKVFDRATQRLIDIIALHLSDVSPAERLSQTKHLLSEIDHSQPYVLAGDWNEMHHSGLIPALLGSSAVDSLLGLLPSERCRSLARRTHGMAAGTSLQLLKEDGWRDSANHHRPTTGIKSLPLLPLQRFMISPVVFNFGVRYGRLQPHLSDHLPVMDLFSTIEDNGVQAPTVRPPSM